MNKSIKYLSITILISCIAVSLTIILSTIIKSNAEVYKAKMDRYYFYHDSIDDILFTFDKSTGTYYYNIYDDKTKSRKYYIRNDILRQSYAKLLHK